MENKSEEGPICHDSRTETSQYRTNGAISVEEKKARRSKQRLTSVAEGSSMSPVRLRLYEVNRKSAKMGGIRGEKCDKSKRTDKDIEESFSSQTFFRDFEP
jgi:hypothetical protein